MFTGEGAVVALLSSIGEVFTHIVGNIASVLGMFVDNTILVLLLGLMVTGAVFSFAMRLIYRR